MATSERPLDRAARRTRRACLTLGEELRNARIEHGLSQATVGRAAGMSGAHVSRIERGAVAGLTLGGACRLSEVLGLGLSIKLYPVGSPVRDAAHLALLERARLALPLGSWTFEVPLPSPNDLRAWDAVLKFPAGRVGLEAETHLSDVQATQRKVQLKQRDDPGIGCAILAVADTRHNRAVVRAHLDTLRAGFPLDREALIAAFRAGRMPAANALILV